MVSRDPSILLCSILGMDVGVRIHKRRMQEWRAIREKYADKPRAALGFRIYLNPEDSSPVSSSIAADGFLDLPLTSLLLKILKPGMCVVDVGANLGYYTLLASKIVREHGTVYSFEPEPVNFRLFNMSLGENQSHNVLQLQEAVSDTWGIIKLYRADASQPQQHSIAFDWGKGAENVKSITLDQFWEIEGRPQIDLVKVHVVGEDPLVLRGAKRVLNQVRPMVTMVFDPPKWRSEAQLLTSIFALYNVYEIVQSPFLIKPIQPSSLERSRGKARELFLNPRKDSPPRTK